MACTICQDLTRLKKSNSHFEKPFACSADGGVFSFTRSRKANIIAGKPSRSVCAPGSEPEIAYAFANQP
jgi:hypothetical protein